MEMGKWTGLLYSGCNFDSKGWPGVYQLFKQYEPANLKPLVFGIARPADQRSSEIRYGEEAFSQKVPPAVLGKNNADGDFLDQYYLTHSFKQTERGGKF